jgi:ABC-2 type transport system permease protein
VSALRLPWAFIVRDVRVEASFKAGLLLRVFSGLFGVLLFYYVAEFVRRVADTSFEQYGGYFAFVVVGLAVFAYMSQGIGGIATSTRDAQASGALELLVLSPARSSTLLVSASMPGYVFGVLTLVVYLLTAAVLGVDFGGANVPVALLALVLATASFVALGLLAAAFLFATQRGNPVSWAVRVSSMLLAGVLYPVDVLPEPLRVLGQALPLTHALELERRSLLLGEGLAELWPTLLVLAGLTAVYFPLGLAACKLGLRLARTDGRLSQ